MNPLFIKQPSNKIWTGFRFPMGAFFVYDEDGNFAMGKINPATKVILEWYEYEKGPSH